MATGWGLSPASPTFHLPFVSQVATQFKLSLLQLVEILKSKEPAYIRCIKPNDAKQPGSTLLPRGAWGAGWPLARASLVTVLLLPLPQVALTRC